jgi:hypothetical protein
LASPTALPSEVGLNHYWLPPCRYCGQFVDWTAWRFPGGTTAHDECYRRALAEVSRDVGSIDPAQPEPNPNTAEQHLLALASLTEAEWPELAQVRAIIRSGKQAPPFGEEP